MQIFNPLERALKKAMYVLSISACGFMIWLLGIAKLMIFKIWLFGTGFKDYGRSHANELIYQLIVTIIGGAIAGYIVARLAR